MPSPYTIPSAVAGAGDPAAEFNTMRAAVLDMGNTRFPAADQVQYICAVGQSFSSSWYFTASTSTLRNQQDIAVPIFIPYPIEIDQVSFSVTVAATTNTVADLALCSVDQTNFDWDVVSTLATSISLASTGTIVVALSPALALPVGLHGFRLFQNGSYDTVFRVNGAKLIGPGTNVVGTYTQVGFPINTNIAVTTHVPFLRFRRSA